MEKKKFKDTKAGKLLINFGKGMLKEIPVIGAGLEHLADEELGGGKGKVSGSHLTGQLTGAVLIAGLIILVALGKLDAELFTSIIEALF